MTLWTLAGRGFAMREIARKLGVSEGAVRYQLRRRSEGAVDGRPPRSGARRRLAEHLSDVEGIEPTIAHPTSEKWVPSPDESVDRGSLGLEVSRA